MKKQFLVITSVFVLFAANILFAEEYPTNISRAVDNYLAALNHSNPGVVGSAIINIMKLKTEYPDLDYTKLVETLKKTSLNSKNQVTRRKAYIAALYLRHPERFNWIKKGTYEENNAFFELLALRIEMQEQNLRTKLVTADSTR
jgi:hypothetical protein